MLIDTDVLIWYFRRDAGAVKLVESLIPFSISVVTYMELVQGMRDKIELRELSRFIKQNGIKVLHISEDISERAAHLVELNYHSHSLDMADALVAATAREYGKTLLTGNIKHYKSVTDLDTKTFRHKAP
jgi:predicted nucleic acid-binding protein